MQVITRLAALLLCLFATTATAQPERPRPLGWAMDAMRAGNWDTAQRIAARDGVVAADVIEWHRLRTGRGTYTEYMDFLNRRFDWPGMEYLRRQGEEAAIKAGTAAVRAYFAEAEPQTPRGVLAYADAMTEQGQTGEAQASVVLAWTTLPMDKEEEALFLSRHSALLKPHHEARADTMLWLGELNEAERLRPLLDAGHQALVEARIALAQRRDDVDARIAAVPAALQSDPGLQHARFVWRLRKGRSADAKALLLERSTSAAALGRPDAWSNQRRALARDEMRDGDPKRAYQLASRHFLTSGSDYADLEWIAGYVALRKLNDPAIALKHFQNHRNAVESPISRGRAGYWIGLAYQALGDAAAADQAFADGAQFQTSFYGILAAEKAGQPFDIGLGPQAEATDWRTSPLIHSPLFEAGMLLQASGELSVAERFWTHLADQLDEEQAAQLGQAAIDVNQPHLAVMIGKTVAYRGITLAAPYYPLHPLTEQDLPIAPEMALSIARRESEFDPVVQSGVGARGLMQLMPATAKEVAGQLGLGEAHTTDRLITDPAYNAQLGSTFLSTLAGRFDGNVVMMSAAYNAGPSRPIRWMEMYGDPRKDNIDVVDWIENIPFRETRNYVMRVTESLPVYRARLGKEPLPIPFSQELKGSTLLSFAPKGK
ncbi:lytic transglycosylase domain-containing protein [Sulfitobacter pseudonitzschiae]|uniref:Lytic transglycosylase domain-containing protein n=1 Tax=Pseudosulfitobacter pseudonitzschiae TaxID=1402135 RepID=A0A9Q2RUZ7_9RHOB|nr:lytic transglycosylase domain-containing protein [Pseudosulfitobacter pseudonitzschiae]MBM2292477.1 lytic transglycosylase domain-containing protein [Pseudosulfitobacter pseudonitzschiae]MBM2297394.1 lytic transglycosylase domain-containing protein [Pseudosulfitobacter pseudonitzschiae]MBM2302308.1 lytic transglycosylase domain-containing protein [Pseudosulfitobacter pseudonitzschiae]MBM2312091.1 lytic transglycosylase domain-containing protein [Pseudosulfitobacter pseudonitzschiae]MBM23170